VGSYVGLARLTVSGSGAAEGTTVAAVALESEGAAAGTLEAPETLADDDLLPHPSESALSASSEAADRNRGSTAQCRIRTVALRKRYAPSVPAASQR